MKKVILTMLVSMLCVFSLKAFAEEDLRKTHIFGLYTEGSYIKNLDEYQLISPYYRRNINNRIVRYISIKGNFHMSRWENSYRRGTEQEVSKEGYRSYFGLMDMNLAAGKYFAVIPTFIFGLIEDYPAFGGGFGVRVGRVDSINLLFNWDVTKSMGFRVEGIFTNPITKSFSLIFLTRYDNYNYDSRKKIRMGAGGEFKMGKHFMLTPVVGVSAIDTDNVGIFSTLSLSFF